MRLTRGRLLSLALVAFPAVAGYIVVRDLIRGYWTTRGAKVEHFTLHSRFVHGKLHEIRVVPAQHGNWTLVLLHGRGDGPSGMLSQSLFDALHGLGSRAPVVLFPDGGDHSDWHNRADGRWGSMVLREIVPSHGRVAIGGISMGGYGALLFEGGQDSSYWHSHMRQYLAFYARHCA